MAAQACTQANWLGGTQRAGKMKNLQKPPEIGKVTDFDENGTSPSLRSHQCPEVQKSQIHGHLTPLNPLYVAKNGHFWENMTFF